MLRFTFKSFSFNQAGNGSQKLSCKINFCLKETECAAQTEKTGLSCNINEAEKWVVPNGAVAENDGANDGADDGANDGANTGADDGADDGSHSDLNML